MISSKFLALPMLALAFVGGPSQGPAQVAVDIGVAPVCPYGYFDYAPYDCAPYGYYGPDWFLGGVFLGKALECHQQEGLPGARRDLGDVLLGRHNALARLGLAIHRQGAPDLGEEPIEPDPRIGAFRQHFRAGDQRFQGCRHVGVAGGLAAGQGASITAQKR